jgi:hypothetical protein
MLTASQSCDVEVLRRARGSEGTQDGPADNDERESADSSEAGGFRVYRRGSQGCYMSWW